MIEKIKLQLKILQLQLRIMLLKEKLTVPNLNDPRYIIIHHGAGQLNFEQVNEYHKGKWGFISSLGFGIGYQYFISYSGRVYRGRMDNEEAAATIGFNKCSINCCLQGNFETEQPTDLQLKSLKELIDKKKTEYKISNENIKGHRNFSNTSCPGKNLYSWLIKNYS